MASTVVMAIPSSTLVWSDHANFVANGIKKLYATKDGADLEIRCREKKFTIHKLVAGLFTDYFSNSDCVWMRIDLNPVHVERLIHFMYNGEVVVQYDHVEGFLETCKLLRVRLFKDVGMADPAANTFAAAVTEADRSAVAVDGFITAYELNDFQLLCRNCYKLFNDDKSLKKHTWGCMRPRNLTCQYCPKTFRHKNDVMNHERFHRNERPFVCKRDGCDRSFTIKGALVTHIKTFHDKILFECQHCLKKFKSKLYLRTHIADKHTEDKPFGCTMCGKCFAIKSLLTQHMSVAHKSIRQYKNRVKMPESKDSKENEAMMQNMNDLI